MNSGRLRGVDAARGLAAGLVLIHHLDVFFPIALTGLLGNSFALSLLNALSSLNSEAVMLFFVISGFCIQATSRRYDFFRRNDLAHYGLRRAARILPPYLIAIAFTFAIGMVMGRTADKSFSFETLAGNLAFVQTSDGMRGTWFVPFGNNAPLWSLSFEVFYYVIFPAAILLELRLLGGFGLRRSLAGLALTFAGCCASLLCYELLPNPIMLFATLYFVWRIGVSIEDVQSKLASPAELAGMLLLLAILIATVIWLRGSATLELMLSGAIIGMLWLLLRRQELAWLLNSPPVGALVGVLARIGLISYSLYLLHYPILQLTKYLMSDTWIALLVAVAAALIAATATERAGAWMQRRVLAGSAKLA